MTTTHRNISITDQRKRRWSHRRSAGTAHSARCASMSVRWSRTSLPTFRNGMRRPRIRRLTKWSPASLNAGTSHFFVVDRRVVKLRWWATSWGDFQSVSPRSVTSPSFPTPPTSDISMHANVVLLASIPSGNNPFAAIDEGGEACDGTHLLLDAGTPRSQPTPRARGGRLPVHASSSALAPAMRHSSQISLARRSTDECPSQVRVVAVYVGRPVHEGAMGADAEA